MLRERDVRAPASPAAREGRAGGEEATPGRKGAMSGGVNPGVAAVSPGPGCYRLAQKPNSADAP